jgi:hypothetical protein
MVYALHKFRHFFIVKYIYFLCRPYGSGVLSQQTTSVRKDNKMVVVILRVQVHIVYKHDITHVVANVLFRLLDSLKPLGVPYQIVDASLFSIEPIWM